MADKGTILDDRMWLELFENCYMEDAELAEKAAKLWHRLLSQIESGSEGTREVRDFLQRSIRFAFEHTARFRECRDEFESSLDESFNAE